MAVCYWGKDVESEGPWKRLMDLTVNTRPQVGNCRMCFPSAAGCDPPFLGL